MRRDRKWIATTRAADGRRFGTPVVLVVRIWYTRGTHLVHPWYSFGTPVVPIWYTRGTHLVHPWCAFGTSVLFKHRLALSSGAADHSPMPHHCNPITTPPLTHQPHHSPTTNPPEARDTIEVELRRDQGVPRRCHRGVRHAALLAYFHWTSQRSRRTMGRYIYIYIYIYRWVQ